MAEPWSIRRGWCPLCLFVLELDLGHLTRCVFEHANSIVFSDGTELRFPPPIWQRRRQR